MRFVDYKCNDCNAVDEYVVNSNDGNNVKCSSCGSLNTLRIVKCSSCGSLNTLRIFAPISFKTSSSSGKDCGCDSSSCASPSKSCAGGSCSTCSGCH